METIKRKNLIFNSLTDFFIKHQQAGIATYTELIMALPGETYDSFTGGIDALFNAGIHNSLLVYDCVVLPNAPMNDEEYKKYHGIKTTRVPVFLNHSVPGENYTQEYEYIITATKTMPECDYREASLFAWIIQTCHTLNYTQFVSIYLKKIYGLEYSNFYKEKGLSPENLSRTLEDSGTVTSVLIPWNTCGAYHSSVLGVSTLTYLPYCFFNIISPFMTVLFAYLKIKIRRL